MLEADWYPVTEEHTAIPKNASNISRVATPIMPFCREKRVLSPDNTSSCMCSSASYTSPDINHNYRPESVKEDHVISFPPV